MPRSMLTCFVVFALVIGAATADAAVHQYDTFRLGWLNPSQPSQPGNEGPFLMTEVGGDGDIFRTFCVETTQYFNPGNTYTVDGISLQSMSTNFKLSGYTAWIYSMYIGQNGWHLSAAWNALPQTAVQQTRTKYNMLQYAIWAGMTKTTPLDHDAIGSSLAEQQFGMTNPWMGAAGHWTSAQLDAYGLGLNSFENSGWGGNADPYTYTGNVVVLNLKSVSGEAQDQLGLDSTAPAPVPPVPEPATLAIWSLGLGVAGVLKLRRRKLAA